MSEPTDFEFERYLEDDEHRSTIEESLMYSKEEQRVLDGHRRPAAVQDTVQLQHQGRGEQPRVSSDIPQKETCQPTPANSRLVLAVDFPFPSQLFRDHGCTL